MILDEQNCHSLSNTLQFSIAIYGAYVLVTIILVVESRDPCALGASYNIKAAFPFKC